MGMSLDDLVFLYSQDLSNCTTYLLAEQTSGGFLYSQDLSNGTTKC